MGTDIDSVIEEIEKAISESQYLESCDGKSRELAIVITKLQEGLLWAKEIKNKK